MDAKVGTSIAGTFFAGLLALLKARGRRRRRCDDHERRLAEAEARLDVGAFTQEDRELLIRTNEVAVEMRETLKDEVFPLIRAHGERLAKLE